MPVDIFPYIDIPIVSVLYSYNGLSPDEMEKRVLTPFERSLTSNVNDIEHIESQATTLEGKLLTTTEEFDCLKSGAIIYQGFKWMT